MTSIALGLTLGRPADPGELASVPPITGLRIGPLEFPGALAPLGESLGDGLEAVGAALVRAERRARPFKLELSIYGDPAEPDTRAAGLRLRRQCRQILENPRWLAHGLYFYFAADSEIAGWLLIGGGDLEEADPGVTFGEFKLSLTDCYLRGRPGTHRAGRRLDLADRRTGLVPIDSRGLLYSADHAAEAELPTHPLIIPGDVRALDAGTGADVPTAPGPRYGRRRLFNACTATDGGVVSYVPDPTGFVTGGAASPLELEEPGQVRAYDQAGTDFGDANPTVTAFDPTSLGWERVYGPLIDYTTELALDNGLCRLLWTGTDLAVEFFDDDLMGYVRMGAFRGMDYLSGATYPPEVAVLELTGERAVIEWRTSYRALRAIMQRGWTGARIEHYSDSPLKWMAPSPGVEPFDPWIKRLTRSSVRGGVAPGLLWAPAVTTDTFTETDDGVLIEPLDSTATPVLVGQISTAALTTGDDLAALAIADARPEPVLLARGVTR